MPNNFCITGFSDSDTYNTILRLMSKKKGTKKKISYHNISLKLTENKFILGNKNHSKNGKRNKFNMNNKKSGPVSFNNLLSDIRTKKKNNRVYNSTLLDKKFFIQNSFNSSDNNYILNNINNNNIIVNNYIFVDIY